jgi:hypothetical protein
LQSGSVCTIPNPGLLFSLIISWQPIFLSLSSLFYFPFFERSFFRGCWIFASVFFFFFFIFSFVIPTCDQRWRSYCGGKRGGFLLLPARMGNGFIFLFFHNIYLQPCQYQGIDVIIFSYSNFCTLLLTCRSALL